MENEIKINEEFNNNNNNNNDKDINNGKDIDIENTSNQKFFYNTNDIISVYFHMNYLKLFNLVKFLFLNYHLLTLKH